MSNLTSAQKKVRELYTLIPTMLQDHVEFKADGCYVNMYVDESDMSISGKDLIRQLIVANQGSLIKDPVVNRFCYQFHSDHPTCDKDGVVINFEHGADTMRTNLKTSKAEPEKTGTTIPIPPTPIQLIKENEQREREQAAIKAAEKLQESAETKTADPATSAQVQPQIEGYSVTIIDNTAAEPPTVQLEPKHITPIATYGGFICSSCIKINLGETVPCSEHEQCALSLPPVLLKGIEKKLDKLITLLTTTTQQQQQTTTPPPPSPPLPSSPLPQSTPPAVTATVQTDTSAPTLSAANTPTPTEQKTTAPNSASKPFTEEDKKRYAEQQKKETLFSQGNLVWYKGVTSTGKECDKLYKNRQISAAANNEYTQLYNRITLETQKKERGEKYNLDWDGYFWYKSQDTTKEPFIGRILSKETNRR